MKLSECRIGTIVTENVEKASGRWYRGVEFAKVGYIVGLTMNACDAPEVIPIVQWAKDSRKPYADEYDLWDKDRDKLDDPVPVHHANLELYTD